MVLPVYPNSISLGQIRNEFGGGGRASLSQFYRGRGYVSGDTIGYPLGSPLLIPTGGRMSLGNFHGAKREYVLVFTSSGFFDVPLGLTSCTALIVAGGGGGGIVNNTSEGGGGGGAGGVLYTTCSLQPGTSMPVIVGAGGTVPGHLGVGDGGNSSFAGQVAIGGGSGGGWTGEWSGRYGGSGGGGSAFYGRTGWSGSVPGQGFPGHPGKEEGTSGGGGGCGGAGGLGPGGPPQTITIGGLTFTVGQGGGGGTRSSTIPLQGGGNYGVSIHGAPNTGGGGTGSPRKSNTAGSGGSGLVVLYIH